MGTKMLIIEDGLYHHQLLHSLWAKKVNNEFDKQLVDILKKLCKLDLTKGEDYLISSPFTDSEVAILKETDITEACNNKEVVARWYDYVQAIDKTKRPKYVKQACNNYLDIYKTTKDYEYLVRKLQLVNKTKSLFKDELEEIFTYIKEEIKVCNAPYRQKQLLKEVSAIFSNERCQVEFLSLLEGSIEFYNKKGTFQNSRFCIDSLHEIKALDVNQWHIRRAENYEKEGDYIISKKEPNTYYADLAPTYLKTLREVKSIANCDELKERLKRKINKAQIEFHDLIQLAGVTVTPQIDFEYIKSKVAELNLVNFELAYKELLLIPIISAKEIGEQVKSLKSQNFLSREELSETVKINNKGAKVGLAKADDAITNDVRHYFRERTISIITAIKQVIDIHKQLDKGFIVGLVERSKSKFIPEDRAYIYALGLFEGFNNNFITAAHLLMPQIEHSLRYIATQNNIIITRYADDLQHENILGGCLDKIATVLSEDLYKELKNFLLDTSSVNFRNDLCHGLLSPILVEHYGKYLWWLTLKLIFQTQNYFVFPSGSNK